MGKRSTLNVYLPQDDKSTQEYKWTTESDEFFRGTETIMLAEDEEIVRTVAREALEMHSYQILEAANGDSVPLIGERHMKPIHLLITDILMPEMSGRELAERLVHFRPEMRVLSCPVMRTKPSYIKGELEEGTNFIQKPLAPDTLARKVRTVLDLPGKA
jgi:DNA-binding NtrC family response regulator